jgi:hypothetical protein
MFSFNVIFCSLFLQIYIFYALALLASHVQHQILLVIKLQPCNAERICVWLKGKLISLDNSKHKDTVEAVITSARK